MDFPQLWRLEVQDGGTSRFGVWWGLTSWFIDGAFSLCSHMLEGMRELTRGPFLKGTNPIHEGSALTTLSPPKDPTSNTLPWGHRFQQINFGRTENSDHSSRTYNNWESRTV